MGSPAKRDLTENEKKVIELINSGKHGCFSA